jgi:hypothetical protein
MSENHKRPPHEEGDHSDHNNTESMPTTPRRRPTGFGGASPSLAYENHLMAKHEAAMARQCRCNCKES